MTTTLFKALGAATTLAGIIASAGSANAASLTKTASTSFALTDIINQSIGVEQFNSSFGTLQSVTIDFTADIKGDAGFENRSPNPAQITVTLGSNINLSLNNQSLFTLNPQNVSSYQTAAYDGINNFGGTSGQIVPGLMASQSGTFASTDSQFLQSFVGSGNMNFMFSALANSAVTGSGNISSFVDTLAKANIQVTYEYDPAQSVPEASAVLGLGLIAGIGLLSQHKKGWLKTANS
ncbi:choice-of-anchor E domain-containing protein [Anabaena sp. CCY 9402-a]|uniref:choice-of-anchor E domain-containing protein n=1 Tax=Anabaena sp. CCY 9402-a TaxID=3103867 RepID=UPI0039C6A13E